LYKFSEELPNNSNAMESGGTQSVFLERKVHVVGSPTRYRAIMRMRESHWSTIASSETGNGLMLKLLDCYYYVAMVQPRLDFIGIGKVPQGQGGV